MTIVKAINLALRFLLELCALAALAYWGFKAGSGWAIKIALGVGAPLVMVVLWAAFVAPKASMLLAEPWRLLLELVIFGGASAGLIACGRPIWALALGGAFIVNRFLMYVWGQ